MTRGPWPRGSVVHRMLSVERPSDIDDARRLAVATARAVGLEAEEGRVAIVATEMATNLVKYATCGRLLVGAVGDATAPGLELLMVDQGPGMDDAKARMADGVSSAGTLGGGFGAMDRLSGQFDLYSRAGRGTVAMSRFWANTGVPDHGRFLYGVVAEPIAGEEVTGDSYAVEQFGSRAVAMLVDGLGHGPDAALASATAVRALRASQRESAEVAVGEIHRSLRLTRGAAVAVAEVELATGRIRFCGIGNISARLVSPGAETNLLSHYGIAGYEARKIQAFDYEWTEQTTLVMHSDGVSSRWTLDEYPGLDRRHPSLTAATVIRDGHRRNDDATVLALRAD